MKTRYIPAYHDALSRSFGQTGGEQRGEEERVQDACRQLRAGRWRMDSDAVPDALLRAVLPHLFRDESGATADYS